MSNEYQRKDPVIQYMDLLLNCGHTAIAKHNADYKAGPPQLGEVHFCKICRRLEPIIDVIPWESILIE